MGSPSWLYMEKREENIFYGRGQCQIALKEATIFSSTEEPTVFTQTRVHQNDSYAGLNYESLEELRREVTDTNASSSFGYTKLLLLGHESIWNVNIYHGKFVHIV